MPKGLITGARQAFAIGSWAGRVCQSRRSAPSSSVSSALSNTRKAWRSHSKLQRTPSAAGHWRSGSTTTPRVFNETYRTIVRASSARQPISPAAEWLLDNFHIVDEQVRDIKNDLPAGFYRLLPKLSDGPLQGYPRVFGVAWALVAHTDSGFDIEKLTRFVDAYQLVQPLTIGELWALAITLRITLVENLRRLSESIAEKLSARQLADRVADCIMGTPTSNPEPASKTLRSLAQGALVDCVCRSPCPAPARP